jgi:hypothetical protein
LNVRGVDDVRQTEMQRAELAVLEPSYFEVEIAIEKLKRYKSPRTDKVLAEVIQAGGNSLCFEIHKLINSIWNNNCHSNKRNLSSYL